MNIFQMFRKLFIFKSYIFQLSDIQTRDKNMIPDGSVEYEEQSHVVDKGKEQNPGTSAFLVDDLGKGGGYE